jgi:hypothetical protein
MSTGPDTRRASLIEKKTYGSESSRRSNFSSVADPASEPMMDLLENFPFQFAVRYGLQQVSLNGLLFASDTF